MSLSCAHMDERVRIYRTLCCTLKVLESLPSVHEYVVHVFRPSESPKKKKKHTTFFAIKTSTHARVTNLGHTCKGVCVRADLLCLLSGTVCSQFKPIPMSPPFELLTLPRRLLAGMAKPES